MKYFFVGYDPGTTSAVSLVGLDGKLLGAKSGRGIGQSELIEFVVDNGKPILIAGDVATCPHSVHKMAARFGVHTFVPDNDLPLELKRRYSKLKSAHERDAEAAARHAYRHFSGKIRNLKKKHDWEGVAKRLLGVVEREEKTPKKPAKKVDVKRLLARIRYLEEKRADATRRQFYAEKRADTAEERCQKLEERLEQKISDAKVAAYESKLLESKNKRISALGDQLETKESEIDALKGTLSDLRSFYSLAIGGKTPVKVLPILSEEEIKKLECSVGIAEGDIVHIKRPGAQKPAERLVELGVGKVICGGLSEEVRRIFKNGKVGILAPEDVALKNVGKTEILEEKGVEKHEASIEEVLEDYRRSRKVY